MHSKCLIAWLLSLSFELVAFMNARRTSLRGTCAAAVGHRERILYVPSFHFAHYFMFRVRNLSIRQQNIGESVSEKKKKCMHTRSQSSTQTHDASTSKTNKYLNETEQLARRTGLWKENKNKCSWDSELFGNKTLNNNRFDLFTL